MTFCTRSFPSAIFVAVALLASGVALSADNASAFKTAVVEATQLFARMRETITQSIIKPAERDQALRYLRRLSHNLDVLALEKDGFAREVQFTKLPDRDADLVRPARNLIAAINRVQDSLTATFAALPDEFRVPSAEVRRKLHLDLNSKLESIEKVATFVGTSTTSREEIVEEVKNDAKLARTLREEVDKFIAHIAGSPE